MGTPRAVITATWAAIQNRQRVAGSYLPIYGFGEFSAGTRCLSSLLGRPSALSFPIHRSLVIRLRHLRPLSLRDNRDWLMVDLNTICCRRVAKLAALQAQKQRRTEGASPGNRPGHRPPPRPGAPAPRLARS